MSNWPYPRIVAHRGGGKLAPENTLADVLDLKAKNGFSTVAITDDGTAHAGFRGQPRGVQPVARVLVETDGAHKRDYLGSERCAEHALLREGVHAVVGDGGRRDGQLLGRHAQ